VLVRTLAGHDNKITSVSVTKDLRNIITTSFDRTFKLW
jgi:U4/U6 small nuclear ribonucleoprotein PRP4